jgi:type IV fimbrial biogenesis protein FimT
MQNKENRNDVMGDKNVGNVLGFTLMEMMVVLAVMAVVSAIAIPSFMSLLPAMRVNGAARQVMGDLMDARMEAVKQNHEFKVFFLNNHEYKILDDNDNDGIDDGGAEISRTIDIQDNYSDVTLSDTGDPIFSPKGTATALSAITVQNSSGSKTVSISIAGRVKVE